MSLVPKDKAGIQTPKGGWKEQTWYLVEVSYSKRNPVHKALVFTGFLDDKGRPAGYSGIFQASAPAEATAFNKAYYMKAAKVLYSCERTD